VVILPQKSLFSFRNTIILLLFLFGKGVVNHLGRMMVVKREFSCLLAGAGKVKSSGNWPERPERAATADKRKNKKR
jgi:hypothetical protein